MTFEINKLVGKTLKMADLTGTISEIIDENTVKLDRSSLTSTISNLQSTFNYEDSFMLEYNFSYVNYSDAAYAQWQYNYVFANIMHPEIVFISFDYEWDILVTHTSTGHTFHQEIYYNPYTGSNNWAFFQFWYTINNGTYVSSPTGFAAPRPSEFPFSGSNSGKMTSCPNTNWAAVYQGEVTFVMGHYLIAKYQSPHNYTGRVTFKMTNIKYYNCRGEEIKSGDKCLPILSGLSATIED